ncbi:hypothetical protein HYQ46_011134 [Verticillium longisporum]|nr:hypothetical protein HYQ46_011134 [Verticillium longisporum]
MVLRRYLLSFSQRSSEQIGQWQPWPKRRWLTVRDMSLPLVSVFPGYCSVSDGWGHPAAHFTAPYILLLAWLAWVAWGLLESVSVQQTSGAKPDYLSAYKQG